MTRNADATSTPNATPPPEVMVEIIPVMSNEYLINPGIGWQSGPDRSEGDLIPETVAYSNRRDIAWKVLNPEEGVYEWDALDSQLSKAVEEGKQFSFRVYSMVGEPFGGHMVPGWVIEKGALVLPSGEPDYANCVYQEEWGRFVEQLIIRYDGLADLAYIDISGYGNFNEWSWESTQTEWDPLWDDEYAVGLALPQNFQTLDGQARRRLADVFIGGTFHSHSCRLANGTVLMVQYSYEGFQKTQLVMPYAGIAQSTEYVASRRSNVGFRFDCLGNYTEDVLEKVGAEIDRIWRTAPVVYELCKPEEVDMESAKTMFQITHASLLHDNASGESPETLMSMIRDAGYRYFLKLARLRLVEGNLNLYMEWQNIGLAPNYPSMGQDLGLVLYLTYPDSNMIVYETVLTANINEWLPSRDVVTGQAAPVNVVDQSLAFPASIPPGTYQVRVGIVERRTGGWILLAIEGTEEDGGYTLTTITLE